MLLANAGGILLGHLFMHYLEVMTLTIDDDDDGDRGTVLRASADRERVAGEKVAGGERGRPSSKQAPFGEGMHVRARDEDVLGERESAEAPLKLGARDGQRCDGVIG